MGLWTRKTNILINKKTYYSCCNNNPAQEVTKIQINKCFKYKHILVRVSKTQVHHVWGLITGATTTLHKKWIINTAIVTQWRGQDLSHRWTPVLFSLLPCLPSIVPSFLTSYLSTPSPSQRLLSLSPDRLPTPPTPQPPLYGNLQIVHLFFFTFFLSYYLPNLHFHPTQIRWHGFNVCLSCDGKLGPWSGGQQRLQLQLQLQLRLYLHQEPEINRPVLAQCPAWPRRPKGGAPGCTAPTVSYLKKEKIFNMDNFPVFLTSLYGFPGHQSHIYAQTFNDHKQ